MKNYLIFRLFSVKNLIIYQYLECMTEQEKQLVQGFLTNIKGLCENADKIGHENALKAISAQVESNLNFIKTFMTK